jgi:hypothetical protein
VRRKAIAAALAFAAAMAAAVATGRMTRSVADPDRARPDPGPTPRRPRFADDVDATSFLRGNLHAHSRRSDGDSPPEVLFAWYRDHGYAFVALTDHNMALDVERYVAWERPGFVILPGEEISMAAQGKPVHVNALCTRTTIGGGKGFTTRSEALAWAIGEVQAQGGVALVNHPNFAWALELRHLAAAPGAHLLEVYNGHPHVNNDGDERRPSSERLWEALLEAGSTLAPAAVDDVHAFATDPEKGIPPARPGLGWVEVFGADASRSAICEGLAAGRLYASNGPRLSRLLVRDTTFAVWVADRGMRVEFLGDRQVELARVEPVADGERGFVARYELRGGERWVRARVVGRHGRRAWTHAYRTVGAP